MKAFLIFFGCIALISCRQVSSTVIYSVEDNIGINCVTKFEFLGTIGISNRPNVLFSDMMKAAKAKFGGDVTITNIRSRHNWKALASLQYGHEEEVLFDVYRSVESN